jgi:hypothetical protein
LERTSEQEFNNPSLLSCAARETDTALEAVEAHRLELEKGKQKMTKQIEITIRKEGRILWTGNAQNHLDAIRQYRDELGAEALDYDSINPKWIYDLEFEFSSN